MRRINIVIGDDLDDRLEAEAAARGLSKSAVVRSCVEQQLPPFDSPLLRMIDDLAELFRDVEPIEGDLDDYLYGTLLDEEMRGGGA